MNSLHVVASIVRRICALTALFLLVAPLFANAGVLWSAGGLAGVPDPLTACRNYPPQSNWGPAIDAVYVTRVSDTVFDCGHASFKDRFNYTYPANPSYAKAYRSGACDPGTEYDPARGTCENPKFCAGYTQGADLTANAVQAAKSWKAFKEPISCTVNNSDGIALCTGQLGGRTAKTYIDCWGPGWTGSQYRVPDTEPEADVEVDYPRCPQGSYRYYDVDGSNWCTTPLTEQDKAKAPTCASGNVGSVNGNMVCLPANPGPSEAKQGAQAAQSEADQAKANKGTSASTEAARRAAAAAQSAVDAANSLTDDDPKKAEAVADANKAIEAAKRAAGFAGRPYGGPDGVQGATGGGGGGGSGLSCGLPGHPKCQIDETGTPTKFDHDADEFLKPGKDANDKFVSKIESIDETSTGANTSWFPQFPTAVCEDPQVPGPNGGTAVSVPICGAVDTFSNFLAGVFAFFSIMGGIGAIQSAMRA